MSISSIQQTDKLQFIVKSDNNYEYQPVIPEKAYPSDIGYDLTLIREVKQINDNTVMYDSGIIVIPPNNHYIEIVPRSSLSKFGYMMANSIGIIDPNYRGTLKVVLTKVEPNVDDILVPITRFQIILRKIEEAETCVVTVDDLDGNVINNTDRGSGGFGSTDPIR